MLWYVRFALGLAVGFTCVLGIQGNERPVKSKARVEFRWLEEKWIEGLTEEKGFQSSCDPQSIVYQHKKPALVLTAVEVAEVRLTHHDFSASGLSSENYSVTLDLTPKARETLGAACGDRGSRLLTVNVDGRSWGVFRYEKGNDGVGVPDAAKAESFTPSVGFFPSKSEAQRLVDALR